MYRMTSRLTLVLLLIITGSSSSFGSDRDFIVRYVGSGQTSNMYNNITAFNTSTGKKVSTDESCWDYKPERMLTRIDRMPKSWVFRGVDKKFGTDSSIMAAIRASMPDYLRIQSSVRFFNWARQLSVSQHTMLSTTRNNNVFLTMHDLNSDSTVLVGSIVVGIGLIFSGSFSFSGEYFYYQGYRKVFRLNTTTKELEALPSDEASELPDGRYAVLVPANGEDFILLDPGNNLMTLYDKDRNPISSLYHDFDGSPKTCWSVGDNQFLVGVDLNEKWFGDVGGSHLKLLDFDNQEVTPLLDDFDKGVIIDVEVVEKE